jgi:hypothetical protein
MHREHWNSGAKKDFPRFSAGLPLEVRWGEGGAPTCTVHLIDHIPHRELRAAPCRGGEEKSESIQSTRCRADPAYLSPTATCETAYPAARISPARCQPAAACCGRPPPHRVLAHLPGSSIPRRRSRRGPVGLSRFPTSSPSLSKKQLLRVHTSLQWITSYLYPSPFQFTPSLLASIHNQLARSLLLFRYPAPTTTTATRAHPASVTS